MHSWQKKIIRNLDSLFKKAIEQDNLTAALQCQKILVQIYISLNKDNNKDIELEQLTDDQLKKLISDGEKKIKTQSL